MVILGYEVTYYLATTTMSFSSLNELEIPAYDFFPIHRNTLKEVWNTVMVLCSTNFAFGTVLYSFPPHYIWFKLFRSKIIFFTHLNSGHDMTISYDFYCLPFASLYFYTLYPFKGVWDAYRNIFYCPVFYYKPPVFFHRHSYSFSGITTLNSRFISVTFLLLFISLSDVYI